jgi:tetraacyldisaccharide-1-P 4'-kinase
VEPGANVADVGDEALMLARELSPVGVPVVVARSRAEAIARAAELAELVIVDGLLQTRPERLACSLLVLDADEPWGSRRCPPVGDLRARPSALLGACDRVIVFHSEITGARTTDGRFIPARELRGRRLGLALALGRPERVVRELARLGVAPVRFEHAADHGRLWATRRPSADVEAWLTTAKCATKLDEFRGGGPVWVLEQRVTLPAGVVEQVVALS